MSTRTQATDAASTDNELEHSRPVDWSEFTLTASGPAVHLQTDDTGTCCAVTETTLHVKRELEDYDDLLAFVDASRERRTRHFESSETNRRDDHHDDVVDTVFKEVTDDYHLGDHTAEAWDVTVQASLSAWTTLYNALDALDDAVDETHSSRLDRLETLQSNDVPGPTLDIVCAVAATHCGNDYKQTDHLIAYTDATNTTEALTLAE